jgi:hypothetical protein
MESMRRSKRPPDRSKLVRPSTQAFARRQRGGGSSGGGGSSDDDDADDKGAPTRMPTADPAETTQTDAEPITDGRVEKPRDMVETLPIPTTPSPGDSARPDPKDLPDIEPPHPRTEPWPDATPQPMKPVAARQHNETIAGTASAAYGGPPDMPKTSAPPPLVLGDVENPAHMPGPKDIPGGNPDDPAPAPGHVPPGDSRSLRRDDEFALIYRVGTCVISRTGRIGTRGQWRVVEYPTSSAAANSYAKECSRFVTDGFSDYRE